MEGTMNIKEHPVSHMARCARIFYKGNDGGEGSLRFFFMLSEDSLLGRQKPGHFRELRQVPFQHMFRNVANEWRGRNRAM